MSDESANQYTELTEHEYTILLAELDEANATNRRLRRQLKKAEDAAAEAARAHAKMVETLTETMRENTALMIERDMWKVRAQRAIAFEPDDAEFDLSSLLGMPSMTEAEVRTIRKAIARLHHPDAGGDAERMKRWNAALDRLEKRL
ncbi:MAG: hypothetical protein HC876_01240 [Chloroflexaceae bacterium]|nr:hypothetical protein [Chloroflexaceae bacterium]NJO04259.1 hypothetical protein [Chloroflexaceae bacterium]